MGEVQSTIPRFYTDFYLYFIFIIFIYLLLLIFIILYRFLNYWFYTDIHATECGAGMSDRK